MSDGIHIKMTVDAEYTPHAIGSNLMSVLHGYLADVQYFRSTAIQLEKADQVAAFDAKAQALLEVGQRLQASGVITAHAYKMVFDQEQSRQQLAKVRGLHELS